MPKQTKTYDALLDKDVLTARRIASRTKRLPRVNLPRLEGWNYGPCKHHDDARPDCEFRECGGDFFDHQTVTISWLYFNRKGLVASVPGSGKTNVALGLTCLLKQRGELAHRAIYIVQTPVTLQWLAEAKRFAPGLNVKAVYSGMKKADRIDTYASPWDVLIVGYHMLLKDVDLLDHYSPSLVVTDDVDPLLDRNNATHKAIVRITDRASRVVVMNASSLQVRLRQIYAAMVPLGAREIWGSESAFEDRYVRWEKFTIPTSDPLKKQIVSRRTGYKNWQEFKAKLEPWVIRYDYGDLTDIRMPDIMPPENVWLDLHPRQRVKYEELRQGVLRVMQEKGEKIKLTNALTMVTYGQMVCAGLTAFGEEDGPGASVKMDWIMHQLTDVWREEKIVVYIKNPGVIKALQSRLDRAGIGHATVWGLESNPQARAAEQKRFWDDPNCRVFMGTSAMERGLNLHAANIVVCLDMLLNPSRMDQIVGRTRRAGSPHDRIFVFNLFCVNTQETKYLDILRERAALIDQVWDSDNQLFESLSPLELLSMFKP